MYISYMLIYYDCLLIVKRYHKKSTYDRKHLLGVSLQFQRLSTLLSCQWLRQQSDMHGAREESKSSMSWSTGNRQKERDFVSDVGFLSLKAQPRYPRSFKKNTPIPTKLHILNLLKQFSNWHLNMQMWESMEAILMQTITVTMNMEVILMQTTAMTMRKIFLNILAILFLNISNKNNNNYI